MRFLEALLVILSLPLFLHSQPINDNCNNSIEINGLPFNQLDSIYDYNFCNGMFFPFTSQICDGQENPGTDELTSSNIGSNDCKGISESTNLEYVDAWYKKALDYPYHNLGCQLVIAATDTVHISFYYGSCNRLYQNKCFTLKPGLYDGRLDPDYWISQGTIDTNDSLFVQISYNPTSLSERPNTFIAILKPTISSGHYYEEKYDRLALNHQTSSIKSVEIFDLIIYPNPTLDFLNIKTLQRIQSIQVIDVNGMQVHNTNNTIAENKLDVSQLNPGVYLMYVMFYNGKETVKSFVRL